MRNSFIRMGLTFRTFRAAVSDALPPAAVHEALPIRSPLKAAAPEVILNVALTLAPGATGPAIVSDVLVVPETMEVHCRGTDMLSCTPVAGAPDVFVKVTVVSSVVPNENVWS